MLTRDITFVANMLYSRVAISVYRLWLMSRASSLSAIQGTNDYKFIHCGSRDGTGWISFLFDRDYLLSYKHVVANERINYPRDGAGRIQPFFRDFYRLGFGQPTVAFGPWWPSCFYTSLNYLITRESFTLISDM